MNPLQIILSSVEFFKAMLETYLIQLRNLLSKLLWLIVKCKFPKKRDQRSISGSSKPRSKPSPTSPSIWRARWATRRFDLRPDQISRIDRRRATTGSMLLWWSTDCCCWYSSESRSEARLVSWLFCVSRIFSNWISKFSIFQNYTLCLIIHDLRSVL